MKKIMLRAFTASLTLMSWGKAAWAQQPSTPHVGPDIGLQYATVIGFGTTDLRSTISGVSRLALIPLALLGLISLGIFFLGKRLTDRLTFKKLGIVSLIIGFTAYALGWVAYYIITMSTQGDWERVNIGGGIFIVLTTILVVFVPVLYIYFIFLVIRSLVTNHQRRKAQKTSTLASNLNEKGGVKLSEATPLPKTDQTPENAREADAEKP